jgi:ANTAR domain
MDAEPTQREDRDAARQAMGTVPISGPMSGPVVVRRSGRGWQVGAEETADLTSAMVLADLLAADLGTPAPPAGPTEEADEAARLAVTVAQLEHALAARVRVEQAIGVLAERHRLRPRQAFDLLRNAARSRGEKVTEIAGTVVDSASNPLLPLPEQLARKQLPARQRGRSPRHARAHGDGSPRENTENVAVER